MSQTAANKPTAPVSRPMMKAATTTPMPEPNDLPRVEADAVWLDQRALEPLAPHDLARHVVRDAVGHVGDIGRAEQCAPPVLAVAHEADRRPPPSSIAA